MNNPKISVIIPVYNVEKYLAQCLDSVVNQTFKDIEIICVNDGSTDGSLKILQKYASNDDRIIIINKENRGVSAARNDGLERAAGDYIMFLDADDFIEENTITNLMSSLSEQDFDIVCFGANIYFDNKKEKMYWLSDSVWKLADGIDYYKNILDVQVYIWDKIFRTQFLKVNNIKFIENLTTAEDGLFCKMCFFKKPKVTFLKECLYNYRIDNYNSATNSIKRPILTDLETFKVLINLDDFNLQPAKNKVELVNHYLGGALNYFYKVRDKQYKKLFLKDLKLFEEYISKNFSMDFRNKLDNYLKILDIIQESRISLLSKLFSIKRNTTHIITNFLGLKLKIRRANG